MPTSAGAGFGRSESARNAHEELLALLVESIVDYAIFALDPDGHVLTWNPGAQRIKGYAPQEIIGRHFSAFYPEDLNAAGVPDRELAIAVAEGRYEDEGWRVRKDGSQFWANVVITALRGADGRLVGFGKVTRDLTERKAAEDFLRDSEERFRLLVTAVSDYAIFLLNTDGTVASWNLGAERLKGYRADEIIGRHFSNFYTAADREAGVPQSGLQSALTEGRWESEGWRVRKDGVRFWADVVITALFGSDGRHRGFAKVTRDLTERKRNEDALRGILERERDTAARLRELDRLKTDLVAIVAHDLRGPVGVIENILHLLSTDWTQIADKDKLEFVERMLKRAQSLGGLIDDVLDLARIEAGDLPVAAEPFDVVSLTRQVVADLTISSPGRAVLVTGEPSARVSGDEGRTWQVLMNLLSNAVKFSPEESPVEIAIQSAKEATTVSVIDSGAGISEDDQRLLFGRFARLPQSAGTPGSGMGLFIAKSLAEAQGGRLWVESTVGVGSTFRFSLPSADRPA